jgi:hypothetical protein
MGTVFFFFIRFLLFNAVRVLLACTLEGTPGRTDPRGGNGKPGKGFPAYNHKGKTDVGAGHIVYPSGHTHDE